MCIKIVPIITGEATVLLGQLCIAANNSTNTQLKLTLVKFTQPNQSQIFTWPHTAQNWNYQQHHFTTRQQHIAQIRHNTIAAPETPNYLPWLNKPCEADTGLTRLRKNNKSYAQNLCNRQYSYYNSTVHIYTDSSKTISCVSAAFYVPQHQVTGGTQLLSNRQGHNLSCRTGCYNDVS